MAKEKVIRNNPNIRTNFNFPSFGFNSPGSLSRIKSRKGIQPELVDQTPEVKSFLSPMMEQQQSLGLMSASTMPSANLITLEKAEETKQQIDNLIADEGTDLNKHTGLGNMLARLGGAQIATEEERAAATPELRELYNQQRLAARNKGIGQMLFALSDALGGRDVVGRFEERQAAMQPEEEDLTAAQKNLQAYYNIINDPNSTQEEKEMARSLIGGIGKSTKQSDEELRRRVGLVQNPLTGQFLSREEIEERIKLIKEVPSNTLESNLPSPELNSANDKQAADLVNYYNNLNL